MTECDTSKLSISLLEISKTVLDNNNIADLLAAYGEYEFTTHLVTAEAKYTKMVDEINKDDHHIMKFRILDKSGPSSCNNIYKLINSNINNSDYTLQLLVYIGCCRCCQESYVKMEVVFENFEEEIIQAVYINDKDVYPKLYSNIYNYVKEKWIKRDYLNYLKYKDDHWWYFDIDEIDIIRTIAGISEEIQICHHCGYYNTTVTLPCPIQKIYCPHWRVCKTMLKRKDLDQHLIECNTTSYPCKYDNCPIKLCIDELIKHQEICVYRTTNCKVKNCRWSGAFKDLECHTKIKSDGSNWMPWETESDMICNGVE